MFAGAAAVSLTLLGCSATEPEQTGDAEEFTHSEFDAADPGPFLGVCGSATGDRVRALLPGRDLVEIRNGVGCEWREPYSHAGASFTWYRGSPIGREHALVGVTGRQVRDLEIGEFSGFLARQSDGTICEIGLGTGEDFFLWSVAGPPGLTDLCAVALELSETTVGGAR